MRTLTKEQVDRVNALADAIEADPAAFDYSNPFHIKKGAVCPTCIGGWAARLWPEEVGYRYGNGDGSWLDGALTDFLGMNKDEHDLLTYTPKTKGGRSFGRRVTAAVAVAVLRRYAATGEVFFDPGDGR